MDYSIGSLSDLITGSNTPNKKKVIKKEFIVTPKAGDVDANTEVSSNSINGKKKRKSINKEFIEFPKKEADESNSENITQKPRKNRKRKITNNSTNEDEVVATTEDTCDFSKINGKKKKKAKKERSETEDTENAGQIELVPRKSRKTKIPKNGDEEQVDTESFVNGDEPEKKRSKTKKRKLLEKETSKDGEEATTKEDIERTARTIFVGNVPLTTKKSALKKLFLKYGNIEAVRFRGLPVADPNVSKKIAFIKKEFHKDRVSCVAYVRFENEESAMKAVEVNGHLFQEHHLKVNMSKTEEKRDESKAIFIGNISFNAEEEDLWKLFEPCGIIESVRLIRDKRTGIGKGFGYINFASSDAVQLAMEMGEIKYKDRVLRISICNLNAAKRNKKKNQVKKIEKPGKMKPFRKRKQNNNSETGGTVGFKSDAEPVSGSFQGTKFTDMKKKNKLHKGEFKKKVMMKKIAPKSKFNGRQKQ